MKCANCGAEIRVGCVYCSVCGKEAVVVPDYNILEDDYLNSLIQKEQKPKRVLKKKASKKQEKKPGRGLLIGVCILVLALFSVFFAGILMLKSHSYEGRIEKAEDCYKKKEYGKAISYAKQALEKKKNDVSSYALIGKSYGKKKEKKAAKTYLEKAAEQAGADTEVYRMLIALYEEESDYDAILKLYKGAEEKAVKKLFEDYLIEKPKMEPEAGTYDEYLEITLTSEPGTDIYYTLDGSNPKKNGILYEETFFIEEEGYHRLQAVCMDARGIYSEKAVAEYNIQLNMPDLPSASPGSGTYTQPTQITVEVPKGCSAYYAWNGTPGKDTTRYNGPIEMIPGNNVLSVILVNASGQTSGIQKYNYVYMP